jgi:hypothetical protein
LWIARNAWKGDNVLDDRIVTGITPYLAEATGLIGKPNKLAKQYRLAFSGSYIMGDGFLMKPEQALALISRRPETKQVLFPYLGGEDVTSRPDQSPSRWVINFGTMPLNRDTAPSNYEGSVASDFPECLAQVEQHVKDERLSKSKDIAEYPWWQFWRHRHELYRTIKPLKRALFHPFTSKYVAFVFVPTDILFGSPHVVIALEGEEHFAVLQSVFHEVWAFQYCSTHETRLRYAASDVFETFPFPIELDSRVQKAGAACYALRNDIMMFANKGITDTYNRFHDRGDQSAEIARLRALHLEMDQAVAAAYGWSDLDLGHGFHATKQGERYTLSEPARRTVLDRLLALNHQRYEEEVKAGLHEKKAKKSKQHRNQISTAGDLFAP